MQPSFYLSKESVDESFFTSFPDWKWLLSGSGDVFIMGGVCNINMIIILGCMEHLLSLTTVRLLQCLKMYLYNYTLVYFIIYVYIVLFYTLFYNCTILLLYVIYTITLYCYTISYMKLYYSFCTMLHNILFTLYYTSLSMLLYYIYYIVLLCTSLHC